MGMLATLLSSCSASYFHRRFCRLALLLAATLPVVAAAPAWATLKDSDTPIRRNISAHVDYSEVIRTDEASPDVAVFPILVAESVAPFERRNLNNKVAQLAGAGSIAVIYPDIGEPYRSVFAQIISGIEDKAKGRVSNFAVGANVDVGDLNNSLRRQDAKVVIALGRQGVKVASALNGNIGVIEGGVLTATESEARDRQVNSLSPDPALLFAPEGHDARRAADIHRV